MSAKVPASRLLPVIRCRVMRRSGFSRFGARYNPAIYPSEIVLFRARNRYIPPEQAYHPDGVEALLASRCCHRPVRIPISEILEISLSYEGLGLLKAVVSGKIRTARRTYDFRLYRFEAKHVIEALEALLPGRLTNKVTEPEAPAAFPTDRKRESGALHKRPRYSKRSAKVLRIVAIPGLAVGAGVAAIAWHGELARFIAPAALALGVAWFAICLKLAFHLGQIPALELLASDPRPLILYLRSFKDDGTNNLHPLSLTAEIFGLSNPRRGQLAYLEVPTGGAEIFLPMAKLVCFFMRIGALYNYFRGVGNATAEQQLSGYFRKRGPFVAIGRPGEKLDPGGASRLYVGHDEWQAKVMELMPRAQLVLLQPEETEGVWWEIMQTVRKLPPERILFCLVNYADNQQRYEEFRLRFEDRTAVALPRMIGRNLFLYFTADWQPKLLEPRYYSEFLWPILGQAINFDATLKPFFTRGEPPPFSAVDSRFRGHGVLALLFYQVVPIAILFAIIALTAKI